MKRVWQVRENRWFGVNAQGEKRRFKTELLAMEFAGISPEPEEVEEEVVELVESTIAEPLLPFLGYRDED